ncbi:MAG: hypothetical protein PW735_00725 [Acidobacteriaceae bacterium]|nr:hypothetical protein [Acidobacteriaceae bacterium]
MRNSSYGATERVARWLVAVFLFAALLLYAVHFLHLDADFPNNSPWVDWSKYTDEGWYGDAAIRHFMTGHWYWKGDFNPAVALPVWPALEWPVFALFGVSPTVARALTLCVFGITLVGFYGLLRRFARIERRENGPSLAPAICVFLMCASPFFFVFERMAILEPTLIMLMVLALLSASSMHRWRAPGVALWARAWPLLALGLLLPAMVLTKTTGLFLVPALAYFVWARAGYRWRHALEMGLPPALIGVVLWCVYFFACVRPHYLEDYRYLFSANAYTGILLEPFDTVVLNTFSDGVWMGHLLYLAFYTVLVLMLFWRPKLFWNPLVPTLLLWAGGYTLFLAYHNNLQPRYYLVVAAPITALVALGLDSFRHGFAARRELWATCIVAVLTLGISWPGMMYLLQIATHPTYQFKAAAQQIARIVRSTPDHSPLILSISGSDITLMTGLPSIDDDFGTLELSERVRQYQPGWYVAWNELDDDKMDALTPLYHPVRVAAIPALDDQDRNLLILYRLDPGMEAPTPHRRRFKRPTPKPLQTKVGQQPTTTQLEH